MIYFREANEPHLSPSDLNVVKYWHVECYDDEAPGRGKMFPVGIAYVREVLNRGAQLQFVFVADEWRRRGFGKQLLLAAKDRWPSLSWTSAMGPEGAALLESVGLRGDDDECE